MRWYAAHHLTATDVQHPRIGSAKFSHPHEGHSRAVVVMGPLSTLRSTQPDVGSRESLRTERYTVRIAQKVINWRAARAPTGHGVGCVELVVLT